MWRMCLKRDAIIIQLEVGRTECYPGLRLKLMHYYDQFERDPNTIREFSAEEIG